MLELYERAVDRRLEHQRRRDGSRRDPGAGRRVGIAAFKVFMVVDTGRDYPHMPGIGVHDHGELLRDLRDASARPGLPLMVHPHDQALMTPHRAGVLGAGRARLPRLREGVRRARRHHLGHRRRRCCCGSSRRPGTPLHLLHTQTHGRRRAAPGGEGRRPGRVRRAQPVGRLPRQRLGDHRAARARTRCRYYVPEKNTEPLWAALRDGTIDLVSTDHAPHTARGEGARLDRRLEGPHGHALGPVLRAAAARRGAARPISPRAGRRADRDRAGARLRARRDKGRLEVGADADIAIVDLDARVRDPRRDRPQQDRLDAVRRPARARRGRDDHRPRPRRLRGRHGRRRSPGWGRQARPATPIRPAVRTQGVRRRWRPASDCSSRTSASRPTRTC